MAQQYNQKRDGIDGFPGPQVYRVVQQVAHAKPVAQHQPIFYGTYIYTTNSRSRKLHMKLSVIIVNKTL